MAKRLIRKSLSLSQLDRNPLREFEKWFQLAVKTGEKHPDAVTLASCSRLGAPSCRVVLYKGLSKGCFRIFTNYESRKGRELLENPKAALCFHWKTLDRQLRIEGRVKRMGRAEAETYFHSRPRISQLGAWASQQSSVIPSREALLARLKHYELYFEGKAVPLPEHWGGFLLMPERMEFWIDGEFRLHDRFEYLKRRGRWARVRLSP